MNNLDDYIKTAEAALVLLLKEWQPRLMESHGVGVFDLKQDQSVVTVLDTSLELAIKDVLRPLSDKVGFVGEEHGQEGATDIFWFVDPIDGTEQYVRGMSSCRTLLTLIQNNEPVYAFAYRFTTGDLYTAQKAKGTRKNGKQVKLKPRPLERTWIEMSINLQIPENLQQLLRVNAAIGSTLYTKEFLNVIDGSVDGYILSGGKGKLWDYAPHALLMREAGLKVTNVGSDMYDYKNLSLIAVHPQIHDELSKLMSS
jgi:myo-inositol-1(or 4)-monophosphatase